MLKKIFLLLEKLRLVFMRYINILYSYWYWLQLKQCGSKFRLRTGTVIVSPENICIGNNFESMGQLYLYADDGLIDIGRDVCVNTNVLIGASGGRIVIGNDVLIAANVVIRAVDHGVDAKQKINEQPHTTGEIIIEDDVWIGSNAVITSNVTLAKGTVVGAGAVVTKSTTAYSIVAGVPARKISERS